MGSAYDWSLAEKLFEENATAFEIAKRLGCSRALVQIWAKRTNRVWPPRGCRTIPRDMYDEIERRLRSGEILQDVADSIDVFVETLRKFALRRGIPFSNRAEKSRPRIVGGTLDRQGYVLLRVQADGEYGYLIRANTRNDAYGYAPLHRMRMHDKLGRKLLPGEVVHHVDGDIYNNSPANLEVYESNGEHLKETLKGKTPNWSEEGKRRMTGRPRNPRP